MTPEEIDRRLEEIRALPENWDGGGELQVDAKQIGKAKSWLSAFTHSLRFLKDISPAHDGSIVTTWENAGGYCDIIFGIDNYVGWHVGNDCEDPCFEGEAKSPNDLLSPLLSLLNWQNAHGLESS